LDVLQLFLAGDPAAGATTGDIGDVRVENLMHPEIVSVEARAPIRRRAP
jgi:hypothetical protein